MSAELEVRIDRVRDQACRKASLLGAVRGLTMVLAVWLALGALDAFFRVADPGLRWIFSLAAWGALVTARVWLSRWDRWSRKLDSVYVARRIEQFFPQLRDRLACAYEFSRDPSLSGPAWGSPELRRAAVQETTSLAAGLDLEQALDLRPLRPSFAALGVVGVVVAVLFGFAPHTSSLALRRLMVPWNDLAWPRANQWEWVEIPARVAAGSEVTLQVRDARGATSDVLQLWYRYDDEADERIERSPMRQREDRFVYRFEQLTRSVFVRVEGGDDNTMPWQLIEVDEPPQLEHLDLRLIPPEYTGRRSERPGQPWRALAGTRVDVQGRANRPIASARIRGADGDGATIAAAKVEDDGVSFRFSQDPAAAWVLQQSGTFVLELCDQSNLRGEAQRFVVQVLPDDPPTVTWELPEPDVAVTASGEVPVAVLAKDDLGVKRVALRYRVNTPTGPRKGSVGEGPQSFDEISLYEGPRKLEPASDMMGDIAGDSQHVERNWELGSIDALDAGSLLDVWIVAEDYKGQVVESPPRKMQVVSAAEYDDRLGQREAILLQLLSEALRVERETHQQIKSLESMLQETGHLEPRNIDQLQAAELQQRQVGRFLADGRDGARGLIAALLDDVRHNNIKNVTLVKRWESVAREVAALEREHLTFISPALVAVRKNAPTDDSMGRWPNADELTAQTGDAGRHAEAVCQRLEQLLAELSPWDDLRRTLREFARLLRDQEEIQRQTAALLQESDPNATPDRATRRGAERSRLTERQFELERRFEKLTARLVQLQGEVQAEGALAALKKAVVACQESIAGARMREAGEQLSENRLGKAFILEGESIVELKRLVELLSGRSGDRATPPSLPRVEQEVIRLLASQKRVRGQLEPLEAARKLTPGNLDDDESQLLAALAAEELALAKTTRQLADDVQADAEGVALVLHGAARQTERLSLMLTPEADLSLALATLDAVIRRLELLREALSPEASSEEPDPAKPPEQEPQEGPTPRGTPRVRGLADLKLLQSLQQELQRRTAELETARRQRGSLTPELAGELQELASEQGRLAELVGKLLESSGDESNP